MAHTKAIGTSKNARDSESKRLGLKLSSGQTAKIGNIIIRQRGTKYRPGLGVRIGSDDSIYAVKDGKVKFRTKKVTKFDGSRKLAKFVDVV